MLANRIPRIRRIRDFSRRHSSQLSHNYPFTKIRAYPFQISPEDAVLQMAPYASAACLFKGFLGSLGARYLPGFGFQPFRPRKITPIYFPAWIIDAETQVEVSYGDSQRTTIAHIHDSYLPGSDYKILPLVSLFSRQLRALEPVPLTAELENQHGVEVSCLPYTISPFTALDIAHSLSYKDATINEELRFTPSSIKPNLFAGYPVLIPLYLAQYSFAAPGSDAERTLTVFMEGYSNQGRIMSEKLGAEAGEELRELLPGAPSTFVRFTHLLDGIFVHYMRGAAKPFFRIAGMLTPENRELPHVFVSWIRNILETPGTAQTLASKSDIPDLVDDPRVREYTHVERNTNLTWMKLGAEISSVRMIVEAMESANSGTRVASLGIGKSVDPRELVEGAVGSLRTKIEALESKRAETMPPWWKSWTDSQT